MITPLLVRVTPDSLGKQRYCNVSRSAASRV
jgi:hypothetical protein